MQASFWILLVIFIEITEAQEDVFIDTDYGPVRGKSIVLEDGSIIDTFLGVPFATPPIGDLRFELPIAPDPWDGILDATSPKSMCVPNGALPVFAASKGSDCLYSINYELPSSEDCLHLNIYTPQTLSDDLLPVMVYIHGGGHQEGTSYSFPSYFLARKEVVVVTINYRLAILGFAYTGDGVISGNMGLMDQVQALTFIQEVIASFGGDPNRVTIFGESAGGTCVAQLSFIPYAQGLFNQAISQSGTEFAAGGTNMPEVKPETFMPYVAKRVGCPETPSEVMVACLRSVDADELSSIAVPMPPGRFTEYYYFTPVIDGDIIPDRYIRLRESGQYIHVPNIIGINEKEANLFLFLLFPALTIRGLSREEFNFFLEKNIFNRTESWPNGTNIEDVYQAFNFMYADWPYYEDPQKNRDMASDLITDFGYGVNADLSAKYISRHGNDVFFYVYDYLLQSQNLPEWVGAYHAIEIPILFGAPYLMLEENSMAYEHSGVSANWTFIEQDFKMSDFMVELWTNFAKYGTPTPNDTITPNGTRIDWPPFTSSDLNYLHISYEAEPRKNYRQDFFAFWQQYLPYLIYGKEFKGVSSFRPLDGFVQYSS